MPFVTNTSAPIPIDTSVEVLQECKAVSISGASSAPSGNRGRDHAVSTFTFPYWDTSFGGMGMPIGWSGDPNSNLTWNILISAPNMCSYVPTTFKYYFAHFLAPVILLYS